MSDRHFPSRNVFRTWRVAWKAQATVVLANREWWSGESENGELSIVADLSEVGWAESWSRLSIRSPHCEATALAAYGSRQCEGEHICSVFFRRYWLVSGVFPVPSPFFHCAYQHTISRGGKCLGIRSHRTVRLSRHLLVSGWILWEKFSSPISVRFTAVGARMSHRLNKLIRKWRSVWESLLAIFLSLLVSCPSVWFCLHQWEMSARKQLKPPLAVVC